MNGGDYPVDEVVIYICRWGADPHHLRSEDVVDRWFLGTVLPKQVIRKKELFPYEDFDGEYGSAHIRFFDTWNQEWTRGSGLLARVEPSTPRV